MLGGFRPQAVGRLTRKQLEDDYYRLYEENHSLKLKINSQNDKLKKVSAKLIKNLGGNTGGILGGEELQEKIEELEKHNSLLRNKLQSAKAQLASYGRFQLAPGFQHNRSTLNTGRVSRVSTKVYSVVAPTPSPAPHIDTSHQTKHMLDQRCRDLEEQIHSYQREHNLLREEIKSKQAEIDEMSLRNKNQLSFEQKGTIHENVELIRLQRQLREKSMETAQTQAKYQKLEQDLRTLKNNHDSVLSEFDQTNTKLRTEENLNSQLQTQISSLRQNQGTSDLHINQELENLQRENQVLRETQETFLSEAFNVDREQEWAKTERTLKAKIAELENMVKSDVNTRDDILEKLSSEIHQREKSEESARRWEVQMVQLKAELEKVEKRLVLLSGGERINWGLIEESVALLRQKQEMETPYGAPSFLNRLQSSDERVELELEKLRTSFAETVEELEKTRAMLLVQHKINRDYQKEVETLDKQSQEYKFQYERQLKEYAEKLDERAVRIQKLESHLRDIAYGRRPHNMEIEQTDATQEADQVEPGHNIVELHLKKLALNNEAQRWMGATEPNVFLTLEFYDFEIQFTPVFKTPLADLDYTCQYNVTVSDLFIHYLQTDSLVVELHQAVGTTYKTWAAGSLSLQTLLHSSQGMIVGSVDFQGVAVEATGVLFGKLDFSVHFKVPIQRSLSMFKERAQALGYVAGGDLDTDNNNQLTIDIHRCNGLSPTSHMGKMPPSAYVIYQLMDYPDHDTTVVPTNSNPVFHDSKLWTLPNRDRRTDEYLRLQTIRFMVFDDSALRDSESFMGTASVPLLPLVHNKPIAGTFQIFTDTGDSVGTIDVSLHWKYTYIPPKRDLLITHPTVEVGKEELITVEASVEDDQRRGVTVKAYQPPSPLLPRPPTETSIDDDPREITIHQHQLSPISKPTAPQEPPEHPPLVRRGSYTISKDANQAQAYPALPIVTDVAPIPVAPPRKPRIEALPDDDVEEPPKKETETEDSNDDDVVLSHSMKKEDSASIIVLELKSFSIPEGSELLDETAASKGFVEWEFLDIPDKECETRSFEFPKMPDTTVPINFYHKIPMNAKRLDLLAKMETSHKSLVFTLVSDPGMGGDCEELGTLEFDLSSLEENIRNSKLPVKGIESKEVIAEITVSLTALASLHAALS